MQNKINKFKNYLKSDKTALCIGTMSLNSVDASIEIANEYDVPVVLIASRRQIDNKNIQRGYVNNWSSDEFAKYVRNKQKSDNIILARDHGGPWQNNIEIENKYTLKEAMESAKKSFKFDIDADFDILHLDPSIDIFKKLSLDDIFERLTDLYEFCSDYALNKKKSIEFEIGMEEQITHINSLEEFRIIINKISNFCSKNNLKMPLFAVCQIGTKVMETKNIGILNNKISLEKYASKIQELCKYATDRGIFIKVHNADYLNPEILKAFPSININAANIAPEFGVCETRTFLKILDEYKLNSLADEFLEYSYNSKKWGKWIIKDSGITNKEKAIIAGHYILSDEKIIKLKEKAQKQIKDINIDEYLKEEIKRHILRYMLYFNMLKKEEIK